MEYPHDATGSENARWAHIPGDLLERIAGYIAFNQRCGLHLVNRHWCAVLHGSRHLWTSVALGDLAAHSSSVLAWCSSHAGGIQDVSVSVEEGSWCDVACVLGKLDRGLARLVLTASSSSPLEGSQSFLWALRKPCGLTAWACWSHCWCRGLTCLDTENALQTIAPEVGQLTLLQELLVSRDDGPTQDFEIPTSLSSLQALTRLELVRCVEAWPIVVSTLTSLQLLNLEGNDFYSTSREIDECLRRLTLLEELDLAACNLAFVPGSLSALTALTTLCLDATFGGLRLSPSGWDEALGGILPHLTRCVFLDLSDNMLSVVPAPVAAMAQLETLRLESNTLDEGGLVDGPYLGRLLSLDLKASCITELPPHLSRASNLQFLGLCCCHELVVDRSLVEEVLGQLSALTGLSLCGQMVQSVDTAKGLLTLGRLLPALEILSQEEVDAHGGGVHSGHSESESEFDDEDEDEDEDDEDDDTEDFEDGEALELASEDGDAEGDSDAETAVSEVASQHSL